MADRKRPPLMRRLPRASPLAVLSVLLAVSLGMMSAATQNSALFGDLYSLLLVVNILGVTLLLALISLSVAKLWRQYRARVMGSRLTLRLFGLFTMLSVAPVAVVYLFSVQAFNRGIDNWFDVRIEQALDGALALGRTALDTTKEDLVKKSREMALELDSAGNRGIPASLNAMREQYGVFELTAHRAAKAWSRIDRQRRYSCKRAKAKCTPVSNRSAIPACNCASWCRWCRARSARRCAYCKSSSRCPSVTHVSVRMSKPRSPNIKSYFTCADRLSSASC